MFVLDFDAGFFVATLVAMVALLDEERGGEGGRPVDGASLDVSGNVRFSRGFLNMRLAPQHGRV